MSFTNPLIHLSVATLILASVYSTSSHGVPRDVSASTSVELRLDYLQKLLQSRSGQRLRQNHQDQTITKIESILQQARTEMTNGNAKEADQLSKKGLKTLMSAVQALPEDPEEIQRHQSRYENLRRGLEKFSDAQSNNKERFAAEADNKDYNKAQVAQLLALAEKDANAGQYEKAIARLEEAQTIVTSSIQGILNNKKLVIELDISTPEKEYYYELRRYIGYEDLIPVAIDVKKPSSAVTDKMLVLSEKAKWMSEQARDRAMKQDYSVAIRMIMDATQVAREALRLAGVTM